jgi:hypothetical protein
MKIRKIALRRLLILLRGWILICNKRKQKQLFCLRKLLCDCEVRGRCTCKEIPVIPVKKVVNKKRIIGRNGGPSRKRVTRSCYATPPPKKMLSFSCKSGFFDMWKSAQLRVLEVVSEPPVNRFTSPTYMFWVPFWP